MTQLRVSHRTTYSYEDPVVYGLQQLRLTPKERAGQSIVNWKVDLEGAREEARFEDHNSNTVVLTSLVEGVTEVVITVRGEVDATNDTGIVGNHGGHAPLWHFTRATPQTKASKGIDALMKAFGKRTLTEVSAFHALSKLIAEQVTYETGVTHARTTAESAIELGKGVCQDHAHIFIAALRSLGIPARYVSGYLMMNDRVDQEATHAWAEAWLHNLGWVGFDVSNGISPDSRYIRVATGLDYQDAAPIRGLHVGNASASAGERMRVAIQVQQ